MLLILSLALFPIGLLAIVASIQSAQQKSDERRERTLARLEAKAQRLNSALARSALTIDTASVAIAAAPDGGVCADTLRRLEQGPVRVRYALYAKGQLRCASAGFVTPASARGGARSGTVLRIAEDGSALRLYVLGDKGELAGVAEFPRGELTRLTYIPGTSPVFDLELTDGTRRMSLRDEYEPGRLSRTVEGTAALAAGRLRLTIRLSEAPITVPDLLLIFLPVLMWLAAAAIGWLIADRLLLRPLVRMQRAVSAYQPGDRELAVPNLATPAREINDLGRAFEGVVRTVARHESELEAAVDRQTRLVREVHHRVKNNLQVVASLLNIHSRGSPNEQVAGAYASIQRRVDALAVVHRNHYAELEENRGVALKPLISELAANLRATAPASAAGMVIRLDLEPYYATQDVAVSVAFLVTEIVEYAMFCGSSLITVSLTGEGRTVGTAAFTVESESLQPGIGCDATLTERFERIVTGLSRQLRSTIQRDAEAGRYRLDIAIVDKADRG
jgi:two-component sensor histidine kinase